MAKKDWPRKVKVGNVTVTIYRIAHGAAKGGFVYELYYREGGVSRKQQFTDIDEADREARLVATKLNSGQVAASGMTKTDRDELDAIRRMTGDTPALAAVREWKKAAELTSGNVLVAAESWVARNQRKFDPIKAEDAVVRFIKETDARGAQGSRTYGAKLAPLKAYFADRFLHTISTPEWTAYLAQWTDGVTRNDLRKRAITLCKWARKNNHLPRESELEATMTSRAVEKEPKIGLISPETFGQLLWHVKQKAPHHLAALVLVGFCGMRSDEVHGKREDLSKRQIWEDIILEPEKVSGKKQDPYVIVTVAKKNTPAWRHIPLCPAAQEWLAVCPSPHKGNVSHAAAVNLIRKIGTTAGLTLPGNCFRHSYISYQVAITGNKPQVATWGGTSVAKIDKNYRRPVPQNLARAWFALTPEKARSLPNIARPA